MCLILSYFRPFVCQKKRIIVPQSLWYSFCSHRIEYPENQIGKRRILQKVNARKDLFLNCILVQYYKFGHLAAVIFRITRAVVQENVGSDVWVARAVPKLKVCLHKGSLP